MSLWLAAWVVWGVWFAVIEGLALWGRKQRRKPDTLSEHVWLFRDRHPIAKWSLAVFMVWLTAHFLWGGK